MLFRIAISLVLGMNNDGQRNGEQRDGGRRDRSRDRRSQGDLFTGEQSRNSSGVDDTTPIIDRGGPASTSDAWRFDQWSQGKGVGGKSTGKGKSKGRSWDDDLQITITPDTMDNLHVGPHEASSGYARFGPRLADAGLPRTWPRNRIANEGDWGMDQWERGRSALSRGDAALSRHEHGMRVLAITARLALLCDRQFCATWLGYFAPALSEEDRSAIAP